MKKKLLVLVIVAMAIVAGQVHAQVMYDANQVTLGWDAVTKLSNGSTIPASDTIKYQVYTKPNSISAGQKVGAEITATQLLISFSAEGSYFLGVESLRYQGTTLISKGPTISWSDTASVCKDGIAFGVNYWLTIMSPGGLRRPP